MLKSQTEIQLVNMHLYNQDINSRIISLINFCEMLTDAPRAWFKSYFLLENDKLTNF